MGFGAATIVGAEHERHVTGGGKASVKLPQFKAINTLLGNLKTAISGSYHAFDFAKYAHRYLAEFQYRFNRRFNMKIILSRLLSMSGAGPLSAGRLAGAAGHEISTGLHPSRRRASSTGPGHVDRPVFDRQLKGQEPAMNKILRFTLATMMGVCMVGVSAHDDRDDDRDDDRRGCASGVESSDSLYKSLQVVALTADQRLVCFNERKPAKARAIGHVSGLYTDTALVGIDFRVQDGLLYGVGNAGGVYKLDTAHATATLINRLTVALDGTSFGVDFNPAADRLRIVSNTGQNLRHNINAGGVTLADDPLDYPTTVNGVGPTALGITGSAYTNNDLSATTATTLYSLDTTLDQVSIQSPPNDGTQAATGKLGVDAQLGSGFDIYSKVRDGATVDVQAFAALTAADGSSSFYKVSLPTGKATVRGSFAAGTQVIGIAIPLNQL